MDQQFLAAFRLLTYPEFLAVFEQPVASRLWNRFIDARDVDGLQLFLLSLTEQQQALICKAIKSRLHPVQLEIQGTPSELIAIRDYLIDNNLHHIIKSDVVPHSGRSGFADWSIQTDSESYFKWLKFSESQKAA